MCVSYQLWLQWRDSGVCVCVFVCAYALCVSKATKKMI